MKETEANHIQNVKIEVLKLDFLKQKGAVPRFFKVLGEIENETIFKHKTIDILLNLVWIQHYPQIFYKIFCPYVAFCGCFLGYMIFSFDLKEESTIVKPKYE